MSRFRDIEFFRDGKRFFRGNIHCHSTTSDGSYPYDKLVERYKDYGYSFLCLSEHEVFTDRTELNTERFITIPTVEWSCSQSIDGRWLKTHHIHAIEGTARMLADAPAGRLRHGDVMPRLPYEGVQSVLKMRDYIHARGCVAVYNHPMWSRVRPEDMGLLEGFAAMEVHNYGCELEDFTGFAETYWDNLLSDGSAIRAVATDDNHNRADPDDSFGGWIQVYTEKLTQDDIIQAILDGQFYASTGPEIRCYGIKDGVCFVDCEGVNQVNFVCGGQINAGTTIWSQTGGDDVLHAEHKLNGKEDYIRIRCQRKDGKIAWCNALLPDTNPNP